MRIAGYIEDPILKITIFQYEGKYSVQFETPNYAQIFKIRHSDSLQTVEDIKLLVDDKFIESVRMRFADMHTQALSAMEKLSDDSDEEEFDIII